MENVKFDTEKKVTVAQKREKKLEESERKAQEQVKNLQSQLEKVPNEFRQVVIQKCQVVEKIVEKVIDKPLVEYVKIPNKELIQGLKNLEKENKRLSSSMITIDTFKNPDCVDYIK